MFKKRYVAYAAFFLATFVLLYCIVNPVYFVSSNTWHAAVAADSKKLESHVVFLATLDPARNYRNISSLNRAAKYIQEQFQPYCEQVEFQNFAVDGNEYKNVICRFHGKNPDLVVIGAHYDVAGPLPGADDNATGVSGILELARLIKANGIALPNDTELVAYTLEEPPYFQTEQMGSYVHAKSFKGLGKSVRFMISLEMIGYFSDEPNSQSFPASFLGLLYPTTGNFIAIVSGLTSQSLVRDMKADLIESSNIEVRSMNAPQ